LLNLVELIENNEDVLGDVDFNFHNSAVVEV
jgi:hypothetical protein